MKKITVHYVGFISPRMINKGQMTVRAANNTKAFMKVEKILTEEYGYPQGIKVSMEPISVSPEYKVHSETKTETGSYSTMIKN